MIRREGPEMIVSAVPEQCIIPETFPDFFRHGIRIIRQTVPVAAPLIKIMIRDLHGKDPGVELPFIKVTEGEEHSFPVEGPEQGEEPEICLRPVIRVPPDGTDVLDIIFVRTVMEQGECAVILARFVPVNDPAPAVAVLRIGGEKGEEEGPFIAFFVHDRTHGKALFVPVDKRVEDGPVIFGCDEEGPQVDGVAIHSIVTLQDVFGIDARQPFGGGTGGGAEHDTGQDQQQKMFHNNSFREKSNLFAGYYITP